MPIYEFRCEGCGKEFERVVFASDEEKAECPECGSDETTKLLSAFACCGLTKESAGPGASSTGSG